MTKIEAYLWIQELLGHAKNTNDLDDIVTGYLIGKGVYESTFEETYEETGERLDDGFMRLAANRWWELEEK